MCSEVRVEVAAESLRTVLGGVASTACILLGTTRKAIDYIKFSFKGPQTLILGKLVRELWAGETNELQPSISTGFWAARGPPSSVCTPFTQSFDSSSTSSPGSAKAGREVIAFSSRLFTRPITSSGSRWSGC